MTTKPTVTWQITLLCRRTKNGPYSFPFCSLSNVHAQSPIWVTGMRLCLKLSLSLYYMSSNSKGFCKTKLMRRLSWPSASSLSDTYPFLMCWLLFVFIRLCITYSERQAWVYTQSRIHSTRRLVMVYTVFHSIYSFRHIKKQ